MSVLTVCFRIFHSHQNYVVTKIEVEKAKEMLNYLSATDINSILQLKEKWVKHAFC